MTDEMVAAELLLTSVYQQLKRGKLDTQAIGELMNNSWLMNIDPTTTSIGKIEYIEADTTVPFDIVRFNFDVIEEITFWNRIVFGDVIIVSAFGSIISIIILVVRGFNY